MKLKKSQLGWAPLAIFSVIFSLVVLSGAAYVVTDGGTKNPITAIGEALGVFDPDPKNDDECEKDPNCVH